VPGPGILLRRGGGREDYGGGYIDMVVTVWVIHPTGGSAATALYRQVRAALHGVGLVGSGEFAAVRVTPRETSGVVDDWLEPYRVHAARGVWSVQGCPE
jgi:hypothetical protein